MDRDVSIVLISFESHYLFRLVNWAQCDIFHNRVPIWQKVKFACILIDHPVKGYKFLETIDCIRGLILTPNH